MKKMFREIRAIASESFKRRPEAGEDGPSNPELEVQKQIRIRKENPTVREKLEEITFELTKDLPRLSTILRPADEFSLFRQEELKDLRRKNEKPKAHQISR